MATMPNASAARQTLVLEAPGQSRSAANTLLQHQLNHQQQYHHHHHQHQQQQQQSGNSSTRSNSSNSSEGGGGEDGSSSGGAGSGSGTSPLEIAYSTISPKVDAPPPYPMHIKLSLIDQSVSTHGDSSSCESPFPMTPMTPGGSVDLSKKQRHNLREQRRILRISNQFDILRNKLEGAGYSSSKKDKFTVLQATLDYIAYLERNQSVPLPSHARHGGGGGGPHPSSSPHHHSHHPSSLHHQQHHHIPQATPPHRLPSPGAHSNGAAPPRLSITAPSPSHHQQQQQQLDAKSGASFIIDSMPSPVPALSLPGGNGNGNSGNGLPAFPIDLDATLFGSAAVHSPSVDAIEGSTATYRDVFASSSMPSLLAKLDGTIVEANALFLELCCKNIDELRLHSLYTMCTAMDAPKMYSLVSKILSCEMASAQSKMMWHFSANTGDRKVFVSVSMIHDSMHRPANLHCSLLPLS